MNKFKVVGTLLLLSCITFFYACGDDNIKSSEKSILKFTIGNIDATINQEQRSITATLPHGTDITSLKPTVIVSENATVRPFSGNTIDFTNPVIYYVTAEDGSEQSYLITLSIAKSSESQLLTFTFSGLNPAIDAIIDETTKSVTALVPFGTNLKAMIPTLTIKGESVSPVSGVATDFTEPVKYTVKAEDGTEVAYTVTVTESKSSDAEITEFVISSLNPNVVGEINQETKKITINVPFGTDITKLVPTISFKGHTINPLSRKATNFTNPVEYIVKAQDGTEVKYAVNVKTIASSEAELIEFTFKDFYPNIIGVLNTNTKIVGVDVPYGTDVTKLIPTITFKGHTIAPASGIAQNFTNQVFYTIEAQDKTKYEFSVMVAFNPFEPIISSVNRTKFTNGDEIVIKGKFADKGNTVELRNATNAPVFPDITYDSNKQINAKIPSLAQPGEYTMTVKSYNGNIRHIEKITIVDPESLRPEITSITPTTAIMGFVEKITIKGKNFRDLADKYVTVNIRIGSITHKTNAYIQDGMNDAVEFFIEPIVNKGTGTQYISVERNGYKSNEVAFTLTANPYPQPTITSVSTYTPTEGEKITIKGSNFTKLSDSDVYIQLHKASSPNGYDVSYPHSRRPATVLDDSTLEFTIPWAEPDGWFKISVVANGQSTFHYTSFYVKKK